MIFVDLLFKGIRIIGVIIIIAALIWGLGLLGTVDRQSRKDYEEGNLIKDDEIISQVVSMIKLGVVGVFIVVAGFLVNEIIKKLNDLYKIRKFQ